MAITGPALELIEKKFPVETLAFILKRSKVFARMHSEQKSSIIKRLQSEGFCVAMIGDGANDCVGVEKFLLF